MAKRLLVIVALALTGCTSPEGAARTLASHGFTEVELGGYAGPFECGENETSTSFTAKNPAGKVTSGTVCCGRFAKGCTVRF